MTSVTRWQNVLGFKLLLSAMLSVLLFNARATGAELHYGEVTSIIDGDTVSIHIGKTITVKTRLWGIDAPEKRQAYGQKSREHLAEIISGETVRLKILGYDRYGRALGNIYFEDRFVNLEMIQVGLAWWYESFAKNCKACSNAQATAKRKRLGLWAEPNPIPPWKWRKIGRKKISRP